MFITRLTRSRPITAVASLVIAGTFVLGSISPAHANGGPTTPPPGLSDPLPPAASSMPPRPVHAGDIPQPGPAEPSATQDRTKPDAAAGNKVPNQIIVKFKDRAAFFNDRAHRGAGQVLHESPDMMGRLLKVPDVAAAITALRRNPNVEFVEENVVVEPQWDPNDQLYARQWHLKAYPGSNLRGAWDVTGGNANNRIVIVDSGVDPNHPDLRGKNPAGWNFVSGTRDWTDCHGHGTMVAGVAAATTGNTTGVAGADVYGKIYVARITNDCVTGKSSNYYMGVAIGYSSAWAGTKVINVSYGGRNTQDLAWLDWGVRTARSRGVLVVAAAGNEATNIRSYPAATAGVLAVAATDAAGKRYTYGNLGPYNVDLAAPGVGICTTAMTSKGSYTCTTGTSFAAPLVSGIAMLVRTRYPNDSVDMIEARLKRVSWNPECGKWNCYTNNYGAGIVQANWAVR